jgi:hypothetical protein
MVVVLLSCLFIEEKKLTRFILGLLHSVFMITLGGILIGIGLWDALGHQGILSNKWILGVLACASIAGGSALFFLVALSKVEEHQQVQQESN